MKKNWKYSCAAIVTFICLALMPDLSWAQADLKKANAYFKKYEFARAISEYKKVVAVKEPGFATALNLAHAYRLTNQTKEAETWFAKAITYPESTPNSILHYAELLKSNGKYAAAKTQYQAYQTKVPAEASLINKKIETLDSVLSWQKSPGLYSVKPESALNSPYSDFSPVFFDKGLLLMSDRPSPTISNNTDGWSGRSNVSIFSVTKENDNSWSAPQPLEAIVNNGSHNGPVTNSNTSNIIYFTRTFIQKGKQKRANTDPTSWTNGSEEMGTVNRLAIYQAQKQGEKWINIRPFTYNQVSQYSVGLPAISADGKLLYFVSDMPGGQGQTDIYFCERRNNSTWSKPQNAGPAINTSGRESFPVITTDGTLIFSSDGHPGMGGLDLFSAKGSKADWRAVTNLKYPLNSSKDDFGLVWDKSGASGFLSSNRDSEDGTDDIYRVISVLPITEKLAAPKQVVLEVFTKTRNGGNKEVLLPEVALGLEADQQVISETSGTSKTDKAGKYYFKTVPAKLYKVTGYKPGYNEAYVQLSDANLANDTVRLQLVLNKPQNLNAITQKNTPVVLENIYYDVNKSGIRPDAIPALNNLASYLKENPGLKVEISAHTDSRETQAYNAQLSQRRAEAVVAYLVNKGIARTRLIAKGYGKAKLLNGCLTGVVCSEAEHQVNRRTEIKIVP